MIAFRVRGIPKPQPRPRAFAKRIGGKYTARMYDGSSSEAWKSDVIRAGEPHRPEVPLDGPLEVSITFFLPRPKRLMRKKDPDGPVWAPGKPDRDNLDKAVLDCLTTDGWWRDDAQVVAGEVRKCYHAKEDVPGALIEIQEAGAVGHDSELETYTRKLNCLQEVKT